MDKKCFICYNKYIDEYPLYLCKKCYKKMCNKARVEYYLYKLLSDRIYIINNK